MSAVGLAWAIATLWGIFWTVMSRRLREQPDVGRAPGVLPEAPLVSVVVAARNEERRVLRQAIESMMAQDYPNLEVVAVDDRSTDATLAILEELALKHPRLRVIRGQEPPPGWSGKPHAISQAVAVARGDWLLATDADILFAPGAVSAAVGHARQLSLDVLSLWPRIDCQSFWERVVLPVDLLATEALFPLRRVNHPACPEGLSIGGFILMRRRALEDVGGYAAIAEEVADDTALGFLFKARGHRLRLAHAPELLHTRDYSNLPEIWAGITRKFLSQLPFVPWLQALRNRFSRYPRWRSRGPLARRLTLGCFILMAAGLVVCVSILPAALLLTLQADLAVPALFAFWSICRLHRMHARRSQVPRVFSLLAPLGFAVFTAMMVSATFKVITGRGLTWRGRRLY